MKWFFRGVSFTFVSASLYMVHGTRESLSFPGGIQFLSLPMDLGMQSNPLKGWECLSIHKPIAESEFPRVPKGLNPVSDPPPSATPLLPVELFGHVNEGDRLVFCFLDKRSSRWFRLAAGGTDTVAQVALLRESNDSWPLLVDLSTGRQYRMNPGRRVLSPYALSAAQLQP
ncbi:MAG: hypothetical protein AB3N64_07855 [Puniceicoccaceae bacterium]